MKYIAKPIQIEAIQLAEDLSNQYDVVKWITAGGGKVIFSYQSCLHIETLEGTMRALPGDYIIKGTKGEFYPCRPDIFETKYEQLP
jgi:hypothetical protein